MHVRNNNFVFKDDRETSVKDDRKTSLSEDDKTVLCPKKCETLKSATDPCAPLSSEGLGIYTFNCLSSGSP